ncbi:MAG: M28 family peptidase [Alphaproteobacteria bacterium]|nr:M28 family peptidase [Alphaproteobacteria bacterium]
MPPLFALCALALVWLRSGPRPSHVTGFDADAAIALLERVIGEAPRPVGSPAHAAARERILAELRGLGLAPEVHDTTICATGRCARVQNVFAHVAGPRERPVLLVAHYDSVDAGPGAADDAQGVAIALEAARISRDRTPRNGLAILLTDAEELGLLGASAFVRDRRTDVGAVVNVEARGTGGRSWLFETSAPNGWITRLAEGTGTHPAMTSVAAEIYRRLPNDTDLTVFRDAGVPAVNFAFIDGVERYHTSEDDLAHLDRRSVQQQGDQAIATWWALADADLADTPAGDDVYGDLLGFTVVRWPVSVARPLAIGVLLGVLAVAGAALRTRRTRIREVAIALVGTAALVGAVAGGSVGLHLALEAAGAGYGVEAPFRVGLWALVTGLFAASLLAWRRMDEASRWIGAWTWLALAGVALAEVAPGASYLFVLPAGFAAVFFGAGLAVRGPLWPWSLVGSLLGLCIWLELALVLESSVGLVAPTVAVPLAVAWCAVLPAVSVEGWPLHLATAALLAIGLAGSLAPLGLPASTPAKPGRLSYTYVQSAAQAQWVANAAEAPPGFVEARLPARLPWLGRYGRDAGSRNLSPPLATFGDGLLTLSSTRGARTLGLSLPRAARPTLDGRPIDHDGVVTFHGVERVEVGLSEGSGVRPFDVTALEGPPPGRRADQLPSQWGDRAIVVGEPLP